MLNYLVLFEKEHSCPYWLCSSIFFYTYAHTHRHAYIHMHAMMHTHTYTHTRAHAILHGHTHTHACMHIHTHAHTHTQTHIKQERKALQANKREKHSKCSTQADPYILCYILVIHVLPVKYSQLINFYCFWFSFKNKTYTLC